MPSIDEHEHVVREYVDAFNRLDLERLRKLFASDAIVYGVLGAGGLDVVEPIWQEIHAAFAIQLTIDDIVVEGDRVAVRYTERGRFIGPFRGSEPTQKPYEIVAMEWFAMKDGCIWRRWAARDSGTQARQMGLRLG